MGTKINSNYEDLLTFTRASKGHALRPVSYGTELVTNGDFSSSDGWTLKSNTTISGGQLTIDTTSDSSWYSNALRSDIDIVAGKIYYYEVDIESQTPSDQLWVYIGGGSVTDDAISLQGTGVITGVHIPTKSTSTLKVEDRHNTPSAHVINSISVKEVLFDQPDGTLTLFEHPDGVPRVEYDADGNRLGLLVEEQRVNLVPYSEDFTQSSWTKSSGTTVTSSTTVAPNGVAGCSRVQFTAGDRGSRYVHDPLYPSPLASTTHTVSVWVKSTSGTDQTFSLKCTHGAVLDYFSADFTATSEWQRFDFSQAFGSGGNGAIVGIVTDSSGNAADLEVWGFQFEADASFPTSYMKTTGDTATRSADVASIPVADFGYNQSSYSMLLEAISLAPDNGQGTGNNNNNIALLKAGSGNYSSLGIGSTSSRVNRPSLASRNNAGVIVSAGDVASLDNTFDEGLLVKFCASFDVDSGTIAGSVNGSTVFSSTGSVAGVDVSFTDLEFNDGQGAAYIKSIKYYPRRLSDAQLQELTS